MEVLSSEQAGSATGRRWWWWWLVAGGVALAAVVGVGAVAVFRAGDGDGNGSGCLTGLVDYLASETSVVQGTDLIRARSSGFDDSGSPEDLARNAVEMGVIPDPLTNQRVQLNASTDGAAFEPGAVDCWLGPLNQQFVARGDFDADRIERSDLGNDGSLAVDGGLLAYAPEGDLDELMATREQPAALRNLIDAFDRQGAISFSGMSLSEDEKEIWIGVGLAGADGDWELLATWAFDDASAAGDAEAQVIEVLRTDSRLPDIIDGDPSQLLRRDGPVLWTRAPLAEEPYSWVGPLRMLDPMFFPFSD